MNRLEQELVQLGGNIADALEDVLLPAALLDKEGIIRWQNSAGIALHGRRVGAAFGEFVAAEERAAVRAIIDGIVRGGKPAEFRVHVRNPRGTYDAIQASAVPVRGCGRGTVVGVFGLARAEETPVAPVSSGITLTRRQRDVLRLLAEGRSTEEIASALSLSTTTVRNHVANLLAALGVHSRLQAVVAASKGGLLDEDEARTDA